MKVDNVIWWLNFYQNNFILFYIYDISIKLQSCIDDLGFRVKYRKSYCGEVLWWGFCTYTCARVRVLWYLVNVCEKYAKEIEFLASHTEILSLSFNGASFRGLPSRSLTLTYRLTRTYVRLYGIPFASRKRSQTSCSSPQAG